MNVPPIDSDRQKQQPERAARQKHVDVTVLRDLRELQAGLNEWRSLNKSLNPSSVEAHDLVEQLQQHTDGIRRYVTKKLGYVAVMAMPTNVSAAKAQEVFDIPELLEMILLQLHPRWVLAAQQVNKSFDALIITSSKIQEHLGLRPHHASAFASPF